MHKAKVLFLLPAVAASQSISVFGHKTPDTDTITSALVYSWELGERQIPATAFRLGELNRETAFVLEFLGLEQPPLLEGALEPKTPVAIVDTNNPGELPEGISQAQIHSIVDHHKLSGLTNSEPLEVDIRTLCSATSILYSRAKRANLTIDKHIAGLMLAGILSDSLEFRSPTTTPLDRVHAAELGVLAGLDVHDFAEDMLNAKAKVDDLTAMQLIKMDSKIFKMGSKNFRVSVVETTQAASPNLLTGKLGSRKPAFRAKAAELREAMVQLVFDEDCDDVFFFVVDIVDESAIFISGSDMTGNLTQKAFDVTLDAHGTVKLPGVLSRKKQIIPKLQAAAVKFEAIVKRLDAEAAAAKSETPATHDEL